MEYSLLDFQPHGDDRGQLTVIESHKDIPFDVKRVFYIYGTKDGVRRGFHALRETDQLITCVKGGCKILLDDGREKAVVPLDDPEKGLLVPARLWREMFDFSSDAVLLVLASGPYAESDYIRNYEDFLAYNADLRMAQSAREA